ncbi:MAG: SPOR domain-containing protein [Sulfuricella denitrificans]|nr:SPOR domain-containing protein [Sulfuricella denitrificans]
MSRDYKPAPRGQAKKSGNPMLVGIFIGMFIGLAIALAVAIFIKGSPSPFVERSKPQEISSGEQVKSEPVTSAQTPAEKPKNADKPRFDFYTILPGTEEPVTEKDIKQQDPASAAKSQYFLQAGAFQNEADADNLKAKLALMGIEASIQTAAVPDKGVWHRVRVGPYDNVDDLNRVRGTLTQNGITASLVKVHDQAPVH